LREDADLLSAEESAALRSELEALRKTLSCTDHRTSVGHRTRQPRVRDLCRPTHGPLHQAGAGGRKVEASKAACRRSSFSRTKSLSRRAVIEAKAGMSICDNLLQNGVEIEHACEKSCACTTCHVVVREGFETLDPSEEKEDDLLDKAWGWNRIRAFLSGDRQGQRSHHRDPEYTINMVKEIIVMKWTTRSKSRSRSRRSIPTQTR